MINPRDPLLTIDAGQILAKLHLAAAKAYDNHDNVIAINSGIVHDDDNATLENTNDVHFDLKNSTGDYQLCLAHHIQFKPKINIAADEKVADAINKIAEAKKNKDTKSDEYEKALNDYAQIVIDAALKTDIKVKLEKDMKLDEQLELIEAAIKEENEKREKDAQTKVKSFDEMKKTAYESIKKYFEVFAGKENASKIEESDIIAAQLTTKDKVSRKSFDDVKDYKIQTEPISSEFAQIFIKKTDGEDDKSTNNKKKTDDLSFKKEITTNLCFIVGYHVEVETM